MNLRFLTIFFASLLFTVFLSCGEEESHEQITDAIQQDNAWTDSIFGSLSEKDQYYQHLIIEVPALYQSNADSLVEWIVSNQPGAIKFIDWKSDSISLIKNSLDTHDIIQPFIYADFYETLNLPVYPYWKSAEASRDLDLMRVFSNARMNLLDLSDNLTMDQSTTQWLDTIAENLRVYPTIAHYSDQNAQRDFNDFMLTLQRYNHNIMIDISIYDTADFDKFRLMNAFQGLLLVNTEMGKINNALSHGVDMVTKNIESGDTYSKWGGGSDEFMNSTKRILDLKSQVKKSSPQHLSAEVEYSRLNFIHNAASLIKDEAKLIPFTKRFTLYGDKLRISQKIRKEVNVRTQSYDESKASLDRVIKSSGNKVILVSDTASEASLKQLNALSKDDKTLVCFKNINQFDQLKNTASLMFLPSYEGPSASILAQQLSSRIELSGDLVTEDSIYAGIRKAKKLLARTIPEYTGLDQDTLGRINWLVRNAMNGRAFPGCQVLLAKKGCIIYDQQFGHHSYKREKLVTDESIYDLASITKVVATTLVGMKLWEMGKYDLQDSLHVFLPDSLKDYLDYPSTIRNITFHELFIHKSGLPAGFPLIRYLQYTDETVGMYDKYFCDISDTAFCIEVAQDFYLEREYGDSMWLKLNQMWLDKSKPYKYSDVNMNTLYYMFKGMIDANPRDFGFTETKKQLEGRNLYMEFLYKTFYEPLAMERTRFKPLDHYNQQSIVPTEDEAYWRHQLLHGSVHDPNAALMGGIAGNAGMFSTTNDLVILCQMLLDKGLYNGQRFLKVETIEKFTTTAENSHRGLGFNKKTISTTGYGMATESSLSTYGHTGFTGTCFWIDPENDLIYIFLSNRVHPKVNNRIYQYGIRKSIHNTAYDARFNS